MSHTTRINEEDKNEYLDLLRGKKGWIVTTGRIGETSPCIGIAEALGLDFNFKTINPGKLWRYLSPWGPTPLGTGIGSASGQFARPLPDIIIGTGRQSIPYMRALKKHSPSNTFTVFLQNPRIGAGVADLICISDHDRNHLQGDNVISTLLTPHRITKARLEQSRQSAHLDMTGMSSPCVAISVGGNNSVYNFNSETLERLAQYLSKAAQNGASFLVTPSRRTDPAIIDTIRKAIHNAPHHIWDGTGDNPYFDYLSHCDAVIVTADSVNMTGEAIATGKPVYVFQPDGGSRKFRYFHEQLRKKGITRDFEGEIDTWEYQALNATVVIAREIAIRWHKKQAATC